jgi:aspartyl-tRNA(Asn)/glutamyl-tRNA(Gln) amidotransferase subunit C
MKIDIKHVASLAKISLTAEEEKVFSEDLDKILDYVAELQELDTEGVTPMTGGTDNVNAFRDMNDDTSFAPQEIVEQFPEKEDGLLRVPKIFE